jgi:hypothetical protein
MLRTFIYVFVAALAFPATLLCTPPEPEIDARQTGLPIGRWQIQFANGVLEICKIRQNGTTSVVEPKRASEGRVEIKDGSVLLTFRDQRIERWTWHGRQILVEHWCPGNEYPNAKPVRGLAERVR